METPIGELRTRIETFLTTDMVASLETVDYAVPSFAARPRAMTLAEAKRGRVDFRHVSGASDAHYLVEAFGDALLMQLQLNVWRIVVVYRVPAADALDAASVATRLERWRIGAEHAGWKIGFRDAFDPPRHWVETYAYANAPEDFLAKPLHQLYWRTDIVQMTRYFMLEMRRYGVRLSPMDAGIEI
jgi:hypothetical protein